MPSRNSSTKAVKGAQRKVAPVQRPVRHQFPTFKKK